MNPRTRRPPRYWIGVASRQHVQRGVAGGFCQLCHGKAAPLKRMAVGDWIAYYSPNEAMQGSVPCQRFTALGEVVGEAAYPFEMTPGFVPHRRDVRFVPEATELPIRPLIAALDFIADKARWGYAFRWGHLAVSADDFGQIASRMLPAGVWQATCGRPRPPVAQTALF